MRCINNCADFEFVETQTQHPITWRTAKILETICAEQRAIAIGTCYFGRCYFFVNVDGFIAVVLIQIARCSAVIFGRIQIAATFSIHQPIENILTFNSNERTNRKQILEITSFLQSCLTN